MRGGRGRACSLGAGNLFRIPEFSGSLMLSDQLLALFFKLAKMRQVLHINLDETFITWP